MSGMTEGEDVEDDGGGVLRMTDGRIERSGQALIERVCS